VSGRDRSGSGARTRPAEFCRRLLAAVVASEGRQKRRKRDTTPDAIGIALKRGLLERAVQEDPAPEHFEAWLLERCLEAGRGGGAVRAIALGVFEEWRLARASPALGRACVAGLPGGEPRRPRRQRNRGMMCLANSSIWRTSSSHGMKP